MFSHAELGVNPPIAVGQATADLAEAAGGDFHFGLLIAAVGTGTVICGDNRVWEAARENREACSRDSPSY